MPAEKPGQQEKIAQPAGPERVSPAKPTQPGQPVARPERVTPAKPSQQEKIPQPPAPERASPAKPAQPKPSAARPERVTPEKVGPEEKKRDQLEQPNPGENIR
jgi:hypothetical protein